MDTVNEQLNQPREPWTGPRQWYFALATSVGSHVAVFAVLASLYFASPARPISQSLSSQWVDPDITAPEIATSATDFGMESPESEAGISAHSVLQTSRLITTTVVPQLDDGRTGATSESFAYESIGEKVSDFDWNGSGTASGEGEGGGFFSALPRGHSFVFVVDCSLSMNHPHESIAGTRLNRLKLEIVNSISSLPPEDSVFYVIFFNHEAVPMPGRGMRTPTEESKLDLLKWMSQVHASGQTDPRAALRMALRLKPDVIYFLTDGTFTPQVRKDLRTLNQRQTEIHTFTLGEKQGEPLMRLIAESNGGQYHFVP